MKLWKIYSETVSKNCLGVQSNLNALEYWRNKLFSTIMVYMAPLSIFALIPGIALSFASGKQVLGTFDLLVFLLIVFISFNGRLSIVIRKILFIMVLYGLSVILIYYLGSVGPGLLYLLIITIFCILIFSNHIAYISVAVNAAICFAFGLIIYFKLVASPIIFQYSLEVWIAVSINMIVMCTVVAILLPLIFNGMQQSNDRYEMVARATSDTVCDWDMIKDVKIYNEGIYQMFGYNPGNLNSSGEWWLERIHPDDKESVYRILQTSVANGAPHINMEYRFQCADGSYKYVLYRSYVLYDKNSRPVRMISAMQDIQQQKEKEHWLKLIESIITYATDSVLIAKANVNNDLGLQIIYANEAFAQMTGYQKEELVGLNVRMLSGPESDQAELEKLSTALDKGESYKGEIINYKKDGQAFWNNKTISPVRDHTDKITHWISIERDVTERNNYMRAIEAQNKKLKEISWTQSHIVRAPLTRIMGLVDVLTSVPQTRVDHRDALNYLRISAVEFDQIIKDMIKNAEVD